jgi:hypothetical protein
VRRAVFCGAQAAMLAYRPRQRPERFTWVEELFDYENELGVSAGVIFGLKKAVFNSDDYATIVMATYAAQHYIAGGSAGESSGDNLVVGPGPGALRRFAGQGGIRHVHHYGGGQFLPDLPL